MESIVSRASETGLHEIWGGLSSTVIEGDGVTLVRWVFEPGQEIKATHAHEQYEQFTVMLEGSIDMTVGDESVILAAGDVCRIQAGAVHGNLRVLGEAKTVLIDIFQPSRPEYVAAIRQDQASILS